MYKIQYSPEAKEAIEKLQEKKKRQIKSAIERLANNPVYGKPLDGVLKGYYSYRSGDYRIIYKIIRNEITIMIMLVGHRGSVYGVFTRKIKGMMLNEELLAYGTKSKRKKKKPGFVCTPEVKKQIRK